MRRLVRKLAALKIEPTVAKQADALPKAPREDLREKIFKRADMIRNRLASSDKRSVAVQNA
jgi:hypothetical protein